MNDYDLAQNPALWGYRSYIADLEAENAKLREAITEWVKAEKLERDYRIGSGGSGAVSRTVNAPALKDAVASLAQAERRLRILVEGV